MAREILSREYASALQCVLVHKVAYVHLDTDSSGGTL